MSVAAVTVAGTPGGELTNVNFAPNTGQVKGLLGMMINHKATGFENNCLGVGISSGPTGFEAMSWAFTDTEVQARQVNVHSINNMQYLYRTQGNFRPNVTVSQFNVDQAVLNVIRDSGVEEYETIHLAFGGDNVEVFAGQDVLVSGAQKVTTAHETTLFIGSTANVDVNQINEAPNYSHGFGLAIDDGSQMGWVGESPQLLTPDQPNGSMFTSMLMNNGIVGKVTEGPATIYTTAVSGFLSDGVNLNTTGNPASSLMNWLSVRWISKPQMAMVDVVIPATGDLVTPDPGFQPSVAILMSVVGLPNVNAPFDLSHSWAFTVITGDQIQTNSQAFKIQPSVEINDRTGWGGRYGRYAMLEPDGTEQAPDVDSSVFAFTPVGLTIPLTNNPAVDSIGRVLLIG